MAATKAEALMFPYVRPQTHHGAVVRPWNQRDCQCGCHREINAQIPSVEGMPIPKAAEKGLCQPCADEAYLPWTRTLEGLV